MKFVNVFVCRMRVVVVIVVRGYILCKKYSDEDCLGDVGLCLGFYRFVF